MNLNLEPIRVRFRRLTAERTRTLLVLLGVVWGTLSLTVVLAFGEGLYGAMHRAMRGSGKDYLLFWSGSTTRPHAGLPPGRWIGLIPEDGRILEQGVPAVRGVSAEFISPGAVLRYGERHMNCGVHGVDPIYAELRAQVPEAGGRFLNERDNQERRRVIFLGDAVKQRLFGDRPAVGQTLTLWGTPFTVVGVLRAKVALSNYEWRDRDKVFVPSETLRQTLGWRYVSYLVVGLKDPQRDEEAITQIYRILAARRGFDPLDRNALGMNNQIALDRIIGGIILGVRVLMGIVGLLGLLVALVGVTNVLYVMVEENRRDIGVLIALGARPSWVLGDLLADGVLLTLVGGALGLFGAAVMLELFNQLPLGAEPKAYLGTPAVSVGLAGLLTVVLGVAGAVAAYVPGRRAALTDPAQILREE